MILPFISSIENVDILVTWLLPFINSTENVDMLLTWLLPFINSTENVDIHFFFVAWEESNVCYQCFHSTGNGF